MEFYLNNYIYKHNNLRNSGNFSGNSINLLLEQSNFSKRFGKLSIFSSELLEHLRITKLSGKFANLVNLLLQ